jgi:serine/threonine protein kinase
MQMASSTIVAVEDDDAFVEDVIPGPPPSMTNGGSSSLNNSRGKGGILSFLNVSSGKASKANANRLNVSGGSSGRRGRGSITMMTTTKENDELQLSSTDHASRWSGSGILASRDDLEMPPELFAAGCNLLQAAARGDIPAMQQLLDSKKTQVNFRDYDRRTAVHVAASEGHIDTVRFLVETCGARINRSDRWGGSPLDDAHRHRHVAVVEYLRNHGAATGSGNRLTNLIKAAAEGDLDEVQTLLKFFKKGSLDINQGDYDKRTALHLAAGEGHTEVVKALCEAGADVNVEDRWARRPLDDAEHGHHKAVVDLLLSKGAARGVNRDGVEQQHDKNGLDRSVQRVSDNMSIEFNELQMIDRIGSGAFGEIYKCRWRGTLVAAKIIKSAKIRRDWTNRRIAQAIQEGNKDVDEAIRELDQAEMDADEKDLAIADFRQEISVLKSLRHPNIVLLLAYSTTENYECLISELMKCSLLDVFKSHMVQGTRMTARQQIIYATQLAQGMNYLHTCKPPIIHRDLKPANLLIDHSGVLKISDFGLSKVRPDPGKNETEAFVMTGETGSYRFMAPEVFRHEQYNETVDIYSYAMILFYLLIGRPPWPNLAGVDAVRRASEEGDRPTIPRDLDQRMQNLLKECWDDNPKVRPPFEAILEVLARYSRDVFHQDSNDVLTSYPSEEVECGCVTQ